MSVDENYRLITASIIILIAFANAHRLRLCMFIFQISHLTPIFVCLLHAFTFCRNRFEEDVEVNT
jgi:type IV secretory pathway VirB6-like protein